MPRVTIDLGEAQSRKPVTEGLYTLEVKEFKGPTKGKNPPHTPYLTAVLVAVDGPEDGLGRKYWMNLMLSGPGAGMFADFISKVTGEDVDVDELDSLDTNTDDMIGMKVGADIGTVEIMNKQNEGTGEYKSDIKRLVKMR